MKARKTINVAQLVEMGNQFMLNSADSLRGERLGVAHFVESVLHRSNAYAGFGYLTDDDMKRSFSGKTCGVIHRYMDDLPNEFPDDSRRRYSLHRKLTSE